MEKRIIFVCEGKTDCAYLHALQRFVENDIPIDVYGEPRLRFIPEPDPFGSGTGKYDTIIKKYNEVVEDFEPDLVNIWVDADIYIRNEELDSNTGRFNFTEYQNRPSNIPVFHFSYHNFEDFLALHYEETVFNVWKQTVLYAVSHNTSRSHSEYPLIRSEHAPLFQKVLPRYSKRRPLSLEITIERLANLRRNLRDTDVQAMVSLQPGISFASYLLDVFDEAYPRLIPN